MTDFQVQMSEVHVKLRCQRATTSSVTIAVKPHDAQYYIFRKVLRICV